MTRRATGRRRAAARMVAARTGMARMEAAPRVPATRRWMSSTGYSTGGRASSVRPRRASRSCTRPQCATLISGTTYTQLRPDPRCSNTLPTSPNGKLEGISDLDKRPHRHTHHRDSSAMWNPRSCCTTSTSSPPCNRPSACPVRWSIGSRARSTSSACSSASIHHRQGIIRRRSAYDLARAKEHPFHVVFEEAAARWITFDEIIATSPPQPGHGRCGAQESHRQVEPLPKCRRGQSSTCRCSGFAALKHKLPEARRTDRRRLA